MYTPSTVRELTDQFAANRSLTQGQITAGRWVVAGMGVLIIIAGIYLA